MSSSTTKIGHALAKVLGIKLNYRNPLGDAVTRGESAYSIDTADTYVEEEPTTLEWLYDVMPTRRTAVNYIQNLFPFTKWILRYNSQWLIGDLIAGITVGAVVVPQGMAYAKLAELPVKFGLYSSFMGVLIYWFFATSKDITIGVRSRSPFWLICICQLYSLSPSCLPSLETSSSKLQKAILTPQVMWSPLPLPLL